MQRGSRARCAMQRPGKKIGRKNESQNPKICGQKARKAKGTPHLDDGRVSSVRVEGLD